MILKTYMLFIVFLVIIFMAGGHLMDIGDILGDNAIATNGFVSFQASKLYHVGFYLIYISFIILIISNIWLYTSRRQNANRRNR